MLLPPPFGPTTPTASPALTRGVISRCTVRPPKSRRTSSMLATISLADGARGFFLIAVAECTATGSRRLRDETQV